MSFLVFWIFCFTLGDKRWSLFASFLEIPFFIFVYGFINRHRHKFGSLSHFEISPLCSSFQLVTQWIHQCHLCLVVVNFYQSLRHCHSKSNWNMFNIFWKVDYAAVKSVNYPDSPEAFNNLCFKRGCWCTLLSLMHSVDALYLSIESSKNNFEDKA